MRSWMVTTLAKRPYSGAVLASECIRSTAGAPGQAGQMLLLAAHALGAVGRPHGHDDSLDQLPERIVRGLAVRRTP